MGDQAGSGSKRRSKSPAGTGPAAKKRRTPCICSRCETNPLYQSSSRVEYKKNEYRGRCAKEWSFDLVRSSEAGSPERRALLKSLGIEEPSPSTTQNAGAVMTWTLRGAF
mmetsp:Transcript_2182/g.6691  ORF Transcript_2182/g.6691 Transcript_2182/m.6691 type:complete len:110 (+) Transcript_2182:422-751(+)